MDRIKAVGVCAVGLAVMYWALIMIDRLRAQRRLVAAIEAAVGDALRGMP